MRRTRLSILGFVLAASLAATGCTPGSASDPAAPAPDSVPTVDREKKIRDLVARAIPATGATGALVLMDSADLKFEFASGASDTDGGAISTDMHFRIASNTKAMTCTVALQQVDAGTISLDDEIVALASESELIAELATSYDLKGLTFKNLCQHTAGLGEYYGEFEQQFVNEPGTVFDKQELLETGLALPRTGAIDEKFTYSNTGFVLLDVALEAATGLPMATLYQEGIFDRLGMADSSYPEANDFFIPQPHPRGYATPVGPDGALQKGTKPNDVTELSPSLGYASGGGISTLKDLARFVTAVSGGELVSATSHEQQWQTVPIAGSALGGYGLGVMQFGPFRGHSGEIPGFISTMLHNPATGTSIVVMLNNSDRTGSTAQELGLAIGAIVDGEAVPWTAEEASAQIFSR